MKHNDIRWRTKNPRHEYKPAEVIEYKAKYREYIDYRNSGWENKTYNEFLDLVKDTIDTSLHRNNVTCPSCNGTKLDSHGGWATCVGGLGDYDPNHHWEGYTCKDCLTRFTVESKGRMGWRAAGLGPYNVWYTVKTGAGDKLVRGLPTCYESYIHTCKYCEGEVHRRHYKKGTRTDSGSMLCYTNGKPDFDTWYVCSGCAREVQTSNDYFIEGSPHKPRKPWRNRLRVGWTIEEEVGVVVVNESIAPKIDSAGKEANESRND